MTCHFLEKLADYLGLLHKVISQSAKHLKIEVKQEYGSDILSVEVTVIVNSALPCMSCLFLGLANIELLLKSSTLLASGMKIIEISTLSHSIMSMI